MTLADLHVNGTLGGNFVKMTMVFILVNWCFLKLI